MLKPYQPHLAEFAMFLGELEGLTRIDISVVEMDEKTESLRITIDCINLDYEGLKAHMAQQGATIQSVDKVVVE